MTWCNMNNPSTSSSSNININNNNNSNQIINIPISEKLSSTTTSCFNDGGLIIASKFTNPLHSISCPSCGHHLPIHNPQGGSRFNELPAGVKFDPTDTEVIGHLEAKVRSDLGNLHPLLHDFIPTIHGDDGICYTHPEKLPGVRKDGVMRHFFHRPSKAYTTGTRKRRKVHTDDDDGGETRWHKTGKTRPIIVNGMVRGFKKILVLYTNYGRQKKAEKTNWVMHQYHIGENEEERDGEYVLSKVFYQTQPRQCGSNNTKEPIEQQQQEQEHPLIIKTPSLNFYQQHYTMSYDHHGVANTQHISEDNATQLIPNLALQGGESSFIQLSGARK